MIPAQFALTVPGIGDFLFRKRTLRDAIWIEAERLRITGGPTTDVGLSNMAADLATISRLTVSPPDGWDPNALDPFDPEDIDKVLLVGGALRSEEARFRGGAGKGSPAPGPSPVADGGVPVPSPIQPPGE